jgi:hypothetical protein
VSFAPLPSSRRARLEAVRAELRAVRAERDGLALRGLLAVRVRDVEVVEGDVRPVHAHGPAGIVAADVAREQVVRDRDGCARIAPQHAPQTPRATRVDALLLV